MKARLLSVFGIVLFAFQASFAAGFASGNQFEATMISGSVTVVCPPSPTQPTQPPQTVIFNCRAGILDPSEFDYFIGPKGTGDAVTLTVTRQDGSVRVKSAAYDPAAGKSTSRFNLWITTLTQRPLLADGLNQVGFRITQGSEVASEGNFSVNVIRRPSAQCRPRTQYAQFADECENQYTACGRYFESQNYCQ